MDDIAKASFEDLIRRLRVAGDKYNDLRCALWHGLELPWGDLSCEFGELFRYSTFRASDPDDWFHAGYYRESSRPSSFDRHKLLPLDRISELNESAKPIQKTLISLFDDAMWLASENGFESIPGCESLSLERLHRSESTWLFLLFHAAWNCPSGLLLRAKRWYPKVLITKLRLRDNQCREVGFVEDRPAWQSDANRLRDEIAERNLKLTKEERESEWLLIYDEECSQKQKKVAAGEYMSILPLDPFTASAALLELVTKHGSEEQMPPIKISRVDDGPKPSWNSDTGKLYFSGTIARSVVRRAKNLRCVLDAFQEDAWPVRIDDPMPGGADSERLNNTVRSLNENLWGVRFSADGSGEGIAWTVAASRNQQEG